MPVNPRKLVELTREFPNLSGSELLALAEKDHLDKLEIQKQLLAVKFEQFTKHGFYSHEEFGRISLYHFSEINFTEENRISCVVELISFEKDKTNIPYSIAHNMYSEFLDEFDTNKLVKLQPSEFLNVKQNLDKIKIFLSDYKIF